VTSLSKKVKVEPTRRQTFKTKDAYFTIDRTTRAINEAP
jgi:hypothetical protein